MDQIGNYRIVQKLGEGGMGEVFKGVDVMLEREVAIKVLRPELSQREDVLERFRREAIALGRLNHANIATVYSFARDGDRYYMALEFVNGEALDKLIAKRGRLAWPDAVRYACAALDGLEHAHRLNVIHRDVKPANILVAYTGAVKIMDFGIARILERARQTRQGYLVGTLEYMSPEQIKGLEVDAKSDIYSLGIVLYEMLTGRLPFQRNTEYELLKSQLEDPPPPPRQFSPDIPQRLEDIVLRALAKKANDRFNSALEFAESLHQLVGGLSGSRVSPPETRLSAVAAISKPGTGGVKNWAPNLPRFRLGEFVKEYPVPALSALALVLAVAGFFFLSNPTPTEQAKAVAYPEAPQVKPNTPAPPPVQKVDEASVLRHTEPPQDAQVKQQNPIPPQENMPVTPPVEVKSPLETPPRLELPLNTKAIVLPKTDQDIHKPEPKPRIKPTPPPVPVKSKPQSIIRPNTSAAKSDSEPDEDAAYWRSLKQNLSEKPRNKPATAPQSKQEDNGFFHQKGREASEFLKGQ